MTVLVASEEERGEVDTYMVLSSYYYKMSAINDTTRHTTQKKTRHRMLSATCQLCWAVVSGRHEDMSSKLTFDDIKNVKFAAKISLLLVYAGGCQTLIGSSAPSPKSKPMVHLRMWQTQHIQCGVQNTGTSACRRSFGSKR
jgi:hypothetical protein